MSTPTSEKFNFMLKEYEMFYGKFEMHYSAVEKTIAIYFLITGAILSANSVIVKSWSNFTIFNMSDLQIFCSLFISLIGFVTIMKVIEHRLLIIKYVKGLNLNRKWFFDNYGKNDLQAYSIFEASVNTPRYFKPYRHFYWEILGLAIINSTFFSLFLISIIKSINLKSKYAVTLNWLWLIVLSILIGLSQIMIYKRRGENEEAEIATRGYGFPAKYFESE